MFARDRQAGRLDGRWLPANAAQLLWERMVRDDPDLGLLVSPAGVARAAYQSWRRLHDHAVPLEALDGDESIETHAFARWCRQYQRKLQEHGWVDGTLAQGRVNAAAAAPGLEIVGFDRLAPVQEALLQRWAAEGLEIRRVGVTAATGTVFAVQCLDAAAELDAAARWAAAALHERDDRAVAIVVPDLAQRREAVRRAIERVFVPGSAVTGGPAPESQAFELAAARPLAEQPVVAAALDLLDAFAGVPDLASVSRLLRNPFTAGSAEEGAARARLDARLRRSGTMGPAWADLERLAVERGCPVIARGMAGARGMLSKRREKELPSLCIKTVFELLAAFGWPGPAPDSPQHQAESRWRTLVSELGACDEFTGRVSWGEVLGLLRDMAGGVLFEPQQLRAPLLVIDEQTSAGMSFDAVWVCGLHAGNWPSPASPDPFIPRSVQVRYGLPRANAELAARESRTILDRLLASAPQVVLSVPQMEDDARLVASPLLEGIPVTHDVERWAEPRVAAAQFARRPVLESVADAALPPVSAEESRRGGARLLELQSACPFRAQAEIRLGARLLEEPGVGVDAAERGDLVHRALAAVWLELRDQATLLSLDEDGLRAAVSRSVESALEESRREADELMRHLLDLEARWLAERVAALLEADRQRAPFAVRDVEEPYTARIGALTLDVRLDRVDRLADESLAVIDYKTGANAEVKAWLDERPRLPQLPAYVQALGPAHVGAVAFAQVRSAETGYVGVARNEEAFPGLRAPGGKGWPREYATWDELLGAWHRRLEALATEYAAGDATLAPDPAHACEYCHLGALCRIAATDAARTEEGGDE
jgi:probable DNA repair protein